jgi:hypothetical protein
MNLRFPLLVGAIGVTGAGMMAAPPPPPHFKLLEPVSWIMENDRGDPQKAGPCGGSNTDWGTPSYVINEAKGGEKIHLKVMETVYHPGFFRVALAVNSPNELPADPVAVTRTDTLKAADGTITVRPNWSTSGALTDGKPPILADNLFPRNARPATPNQIYETDVTLPNINCARCTFQVIMFMNEHAFNNPGGYTYHHCATVHITADPSKPIDSAWPKERMTD